MQYVVFAIRLLIIVHICCGVVQAITTYYVSSGDDYYVKPSRSLVGNSIVGDVLPGLRSPTDPIPRLEVDPRAVGGGEKQKGELSNNPLNVIADMGDIIVGLGWFSYGWVTLLLQDGGLFANIVYGLRLGFAVLQIGVAGAVLRVLLNSGIFTSVIGLGAVGLGATAIGISALVGG